MKTKLLRSLQLSATFLICSMAHSAPSVFFTSPDRTVPLAEVTTADNAAAEPTEPGFISPQGLSIEGINWPESGSLSFLLRLDGITTSRELDIANGETMGLRLLRGPAFDLQLYFAHQGTGAFGWLFHTEDGKEQRFNAPIIHLRGDQTYHIHMNWDLATGLAEIFYNGISQGDIAHGKTGPSSLVLLPEKKTTFDSRFPGDAPVTLQLAQFELSDQIATPAEVAKKTACLDIQPLVDEGRVTYDRPMDLSAYSLETVYSMDFLKPIEIVREQDLFEDGRRIRVPQTDEPWILEGPDGMIVETREDGLFMKTPLPEDRADGHWVLWANRVFPDNYLVEYSFTPRDDRQGLNILFFSAHNPAGETIFDLDLPYRGGNFRPYIVGEINSYHISPWATDGEKLRATSNMRKNSGFKLVARGDDVIGGAGPGPHTVRILKVGKQIRMEANGVLCLAFDDDGESYGPLYAGGYIGFRFMAHAGYATLHELKVYSVTEKH